LSAIERLKFAGCTVWLCERCGHKWGRDTAENEKNNHVTVKELNFDQLFKQISPEEICDNVLYFGRKRFFRYYRGQGKSL